MYNKLLCLGILLPSLLSTSLFAQSDPHGVRGSIAAPYWYDAHHVYNFQSSNSNIYYWPNRGTNFNDAEQNGATALEPVYYTSGVHTMNGQPVIKFDGADDFFQLPNHSDLNTGSAFTARTIATMIRTGSDVTTRQVIFEEGGTVRGINIYVYNGRLYVGAWNDNNDGPGSPWGWVGNSIPVSASTKYTISMSMAGDASGTTGSIKVVINGAASFTINGVGRLYSHSGSNALGAMINDSRFEGNTNGSGNGNYFGGSIAEFMLFHGTLNDAQIRVLHNSLAALYDVSISNDVYANDNAGNGNYDHDVIGIGRTSGSSTHLSAKGNNLFTIDNASGLGDGEFFLVGHNNGSVSNWTTVNVPSSSYTQRVTRQWRVNETGIIGGVRFSLNSGDFPTIPSGYRLAVFVDSDGNFASGAKVYEVASGSTANIDLNNGDYVTVGVVRPTVSFVSTSIGGPEYSNASVELKLNFIPKNTSNFNINYSTSNGSATSGSDFTGTGSSSPSVPFSHVTGEGSFSISITDDVIQESNETFTIQISNGTGYQVEGSTNATYTISDDDHPRKIYFSSASSSGSESVTSGNIAVNISTTSANNVTVNYQVTGGTATSGTDYTLASGTLTIPPGQSSGNISFSVTNDNTIESDETFIVGLSAPTGASLDNPSSPVGTGFLSHTYTIQDNDQPVVAFTSASSSIVESGGNQQLTIALDQAHNTNVTVQYQTSNGTAGSSDFTSTSGTATITAGLTSVTVNVPILNDCVSESSETFTVQLSNPSQATLGGNSTHTVTINDDDINGPGGVGCGLTMWFKADAGVSTSGSSVTSWADQSALNGSSSQSSSASRPTLGANTSSTFNYNNFLTFDGSNDYLANSRSLSGDNLNHLYGFVIYRTGYSSGSYNSNWSFIDFDRSEHYNCYVHGDGRLAFSYNSGGIRDNYGATASNDNVPHIGTFIYNNSITNETSIKLDGNLEADLNIVSNGARIGNSSVRYGFTADGSEATSFDGSQNGIYYQGDIAEIIVFENEQINPGDVNKIESYLALKYGITLKGGNHASTPSIDERDYRLADGTVVWDYSANTAYHNHVAGLGRHDGTGLSKTRSKNVTSGAIMDISSSALSSGNIIMWGHNNGNLNGNNDAPGDVAVRTNKVWKIQEMGETGNLTISVDLTGMPNMPTSASDFVLLIDSDGNFSNATSVVASSFSGNVATFNNVNPANGQFISVGCWRSIIWNAGSYENGSGSAGAPNTSDVARKLYIQSGSATLPANAIVKSVELTTGTSLTIQSGRYLQTAGDIVNNGTFIIQNSGALVQTRSGANANSGSGTYRVQRTGGTNTLTYDAWGSPVASQSILGSGGAFDGANPCDIFAYVGGTQQWKYDYVSGFNTTCKGNPVTFVSNDVLSGGDGIMDQARGYFAPGASSSTREFRGNVNNGDISIGVSTGPNPGSGWIGDNWNLVANPYPSGLDASAFVTANSSVITGNVYFWDQNSSASLTQSEYVVWNAVGVVNQNAGSASTFGTIGSGQGFFVEATSNGSVSFNNTMRETSNSTFFKFKPEDFGKIRLTAVNPLGKTIQQLIAFHDNATDQRDNLFDAKYLEGNGAHHFYSVLDDQPMVIQTFKTLNEGESKVIPLGLKTTLTGKFGFLLDKIENLNIDVVLFDSLEMSAYDLKTSTPQIIIDSAQTYSDRFYLMVKALKDTTGQGGGSTSIEDLVAENVPVIQTMEDHLLIKSLVEMEKIDVYDVLGRMKMTTTSGKQIKIPYSNNSEMIVLKIQMKDGRNIQKKHLLPAR